MIEFQDVIASRPVEVEEESEARFSFLQGGYIEDFELQGISFFLRPHFNFFVNDIGTRY